MRPILLGSVSSVDHGSVVLDVLRNRFGGFTFSMSDSGLIRLVAVSPQSIPSDAVVREMMCHCDGATLACTLLETKLRLHRKLKE